ncbi:MAG: MspA family porin [Mycobacteriaceae bacterium]|nr:MspA family porin [Mycobacteriaceae bacterium]
MRRLLIGLPVLAAAALFGIVTAPAASAEATADKSRVITTEDGWRVRITKTAESIDRHPNLNGSPLSHEGFVSLKAVADITGKGKVPVNSGAIAMGYQIGCAVDVSSGVNAGMSAAVGPNVGVSAAGVSAGASALLLPNLSTTLKPGQITTVAFGVKNLAGAHGSIKADQVQVKIDSCLGRVSLRSYAVVSVSTATADNSVAVYGDPVWL